VCVTRYEVNDAIVVDWPRGNGKVIKLDPPDFFSRSRIIAKRGFRAAAHKLPLTSRRFDHEWCAVSLAMIAVEQSLGLFGAFAGDILIVPRDFAIGSPNRFAGSFVERGDVLLINAVERKDHKVLEQHDRGRRSSIVATGQIIPLPQHIARRCIQASRAVASEVYVHTAVFNRRRWRSITVRVIAQRLRRIAMKELDVVQDLARRFINAHDKKIMSVFRGRSHPNLAAQDDGR